MQKAIPKPGIRMIIKFRLVMLKAFTNWYMTFLRLPKPYARNGSPSTSLRRRLG